MGNEFWDHLDFVITFWGFDDEDLLKRQRQGETDEKRAEMIVDWMHDKFPVTKTKDFKVYFTDCWEDL